MNYWSLLYDNWHSCENFRPWSYFRLLIIAKNVNNSWAGISHRPKVFLQLQGVPVTEYSYQKVFCLCSAGAPPADLSGQDKTQQSRHVLWCTASYSISFCSGPNLIDFSGCVKTCSSTLNSRTWGSLRRARKFNSVVIVVFLWSLQLWWL